MKKRNILITIFIPFITISCNFFGSIDSNIQTNNIVFNEKDIIGTWELDKFSYDYLLATSKFDSIHFTFNSNGTFVLNNSKNLFVYDLDLDKNKILIDNQKTKGKWNITQNKVLDRNELNIFFDNEKYPLSGLNIYKKKEEYQIWWFLNDPDSGERLRFIKK